MTGVLGAVKGQQGSDRGGYVDTEVLVVIAVLAASVEITVMVITMVEVTGGDKGQAAMAEGMLLLETVTTVEVVMEVVERP